MPRWKGMQELLSSSARIGCFGPRLRRFRLLLSPPLSERPHRSRQLAQLGIRLQPLVVPAKCGFQIRLDGINWTTFSMKNPAVVG